jgi:hypothetical protein
LAIDGAFQSATVQEKFFTEGIVLTDLAPGLGKVITFQVKVNECPPLGDIVITNTAYVQAEGLAQISDTARATVRVRKPILSF